MIEICRNIKYRYAELHRVREPWMRICESGLKEKDRKAFLKQGRKALSELSRFLNLIRPMIDTLIENRIFLIGLRLNLNHNITRDIRARGSVVFFVHPDNIFPWHIETLCVLIQNEFTPIKNLNLVNVALDGFVQNFEKFQTLAESLMHPDNQVRQIDLRACGIGEKGAGLIAKILENPNNKLIKIDLRVNIMINSGLKEIIKAAAERTGRSIEILF